MAGRQRERERFRERDRRQRSDNRHAKEYDYERRSNSYSSDDEDRDRDSYSSSKDNYNQNNNNYRRRYSNDRRQDDNWQDQQRNDRRSSNRNERYRSRSRERDQSQQQYHRKQRDSQSERYDNDGYDQYNDKRNREEVAPNNTIMLRNLGLQINENEIMSKLGEIGLKPKEIRLMRKKDTGESRGFAFVEFNDVNEAIYWKNQNQGHITFSDGQESSLHFSIPKESFNQDRNNQLKTDWTCYKCGVVNFKRRDVCFKCATTREESTANETGDEISSVPTNCLLFRNLNPYTTEERILTILGTFSELPIKSIKIPKENSVSLCVCFVELYTTQEAAQIFTLLSALTSGFIIDDYLITISYAKRNVPNSNGMNTTGLKNAASMALAAAQWTNQSNETATSSTEQSSTNQSNSTRSNKQQNEQQSSSNLPHSSTNFVQIVIPFNAPVLNNDYGQVTINNQIYRKYPLPDVSTYVLEETSGYYYDSLTCLYYDPNSHYYYNGQTQKYMYWSNDYQTYLPVDTDLSKNQSNKNDTTDKKEETNGTSSNDLKDGDKDKNDKVKTAKKIMKEMDKWTKQLNQKNKEALNKQMSSNNSNQDDSNQSNSSSSKIGFNSISVGNSGISLNINSVKEISKPKLIENNPLFETFNDNDTNNDQNTKSLKNDTITDKKLLNDKFSNARSAINDKPSIDKSTIQTLNLTDWNKLICLLCKRQFASKEQLSKHQQASDLHKSNLYKLTGFNFTQEQIAELSKNDGEFNFNYRDRAKERREKYGQDDKPEVPSSRYKEKYMRGIKNVLGKQDDYSSNFETPNQSTQLQNSIGAKFLKKFGWDDGQGLGKSNQGRSSLIEMERRTAGVGLGIKTSHPSGESYKDAVKRTMLERYKRLHEEEMASKMQNQ